MPIYAYRCSQCGHQEDVLQKFSDAPLTVCSACGASAFSKQLTAPAFQLKGSGWYVTDFRDNGKKGEAGDGAKDAPPGNAASDKPTTDGAPAASPAPAPAAAGDAKAGGDAKPAPAAAPAAVSGSQGSA